MPNFYDFLFIVAAFCPTRWIMSAIRCFLGKPSRQRSAIMTWTYGWAGAAAIFALYVRCALNPQNDQVYDPVGILAIFLAISRSVEIVYAFLRDAISNIDQATSRSGLSKRDRITLIFISYGELVLDFAIIAYCSPALVPGASYKQHFDNISDAIYFSAITLTTTGYGDNYPTGEFSRYLSVFEVLSGTVLFVVALSVYLSRGDDRSSISQASNTKVVKKVK